MVMQMNEEPECQYTSAVEDERTAWHHLQAQLPGTALRAEAWVRWSEAISKTNAAWRRLNGPQRSSQLRPMQAEPQRRAC
jgi:ferric-dicitrate binding protein FerR (iron transport regulator)